MTTADVVAKLIQMVSDPVWQAESVLREVERERTRTDPWKWYCRICGGVGQADDMIERDREAYAHPADCRTGVRTHLGTASHGRLLHIWAY